MATTRTGKLSELTPDHSNANRGTERGRYALEASLRKYGAGRSILVDRLGRIIAGNKTAETAADVGIDDVIVVQTDGRQVVAVQRTDLDLDSNEARELAYADNRVGQLDLDFDPAQILADLNAGVNLDQFWRKDELDELLADLQPKTTGDTPAEVDRAEELRQKWGTCAGQLWELGSHRLVCGDCTDAATVARVMGGERAALMLTDPPYGVNYEGGASNGKKRERLTNDDSAGIYARFLPVCLQYKDSRAAVYIWFAGSEGLPVYQAVRDNGLTVRNLIIWNKLNAHFGDFMAQYMERKEPLLYCVSGPVEWYGPTNEVTVWDIPQPSKNEHHPTEKPTECMERPIRNSSKRDDIVLDPFLGSGTTIIACENLRRRCRAVEISPAYVAVALERFFVHSGKLPVLVV